MRRRFEALDDAHGFAATAGEAALRAGVFAGGRRERLSVPLAARLFAVA